MKYSSIGNFINIQIGKNPSCDSFFEQNEKCDNGPKFFRCDLHVFGTMKKNFSNRSYSQLQKFLYISQSSTNKLYY